MTKVICSSVRLGLHRSIEIADIQFGVYDKSHVSNPLERVVLIFPNLSLSDAGKQLCCAIFFHNIWAGGYIIISHSRENISLVYCICKNVHGTEQAIRSGPTHCIKPPRICFEPRQFPPSSGHIIVTHTSRLAKVLQGRFFMQLSSCPDLTTISQKP